MTTHTPPSLSHEVKTLITLFNTTFKESHQTLLVCCEKEPIYRPADATEPYHRIIFAHGFFASALHEIAHWCVAGKERRLLKDFGYWYIPDGRTMEQQAAFEKVEVKPQALEWIFSQSANVTFHFSADNLANGCRASNEFQQAVLNQVQHYLNHGLPKRAQRWSDSLIQQFRPNQPLNINEFVLP
ncbi:Translation elongation factor P Lys34 hydroxylase [hydrothermal vent metagenome]|uniref:Translation elongation factor P Lys34 hydroxylase n=1 Tax=hydrothermal vent metagenome TaxID=652676 RepID=A0A3B0VZ27_9ZZZZ